MNVQYSRRYSASNPVDCINTNPTGSSVGSTICVRAFCSRCSVLPNGFFSQAVTMSAGPTKAGRSLQTTAAGTLRLRMQFSCRTAATEFVPLPHCAGLIPPLFLGKSDEVCVRPAPLQMSPSSPTTVDWSLGSLVFCTPFLSFLS